MGQYKEKNITKWQYFTAYSEGRSRVQSSDLETEQGALERICCFKLIAFQIYWYNVIMFSFFYYFQYYLVQLLVPFAFNSYNIKNSNEFHFLNLKKVQHHLSLLGCCIWPQTHLILHYWNTFLLKDNFQAVTGLWEHCDIFLFICIFPGILML